MKVDFRPHITLSDTDDLISSFRQLFNIDLDIYSRANLQLILSHYLYEKGIASISELEERLSEYPEIRHDLLFRLDVADYEMFRNPEVWRFLHTKLLPKMVEERGSLRIWFPSCSGGEELFSLSILALESGLADKISFLATTVSEQRLKSARKGLFEGNSLDLSRENYINAGGSDLLDNYVEKIDKFTVRRKIIRENIDFRHQEFIPGVPEQKADMVIFKNRLLYYTPGAGVILLNRLLDSMNPGGYLVLGYRERITDHEILSRVKLAFKRERIYQLNE